MMKNDKIVELLLNNKQVDILLQDSDGRNVLHRSAQAGNLKIVQMIVDRGSKALLKQRDIHEKLPVDLVPATDNEEIEAMRNLLTAVCNDANN